MTSQAKKDADFGNDIYIFRNWIWRAASMQNFSSSSILLASIKKLIYPKWD